MKQQVTGWRWYQLKYMRIIFTSLYADNSATIRLRLLATSTSLQSVVAISARRRTLTVLLLTISGNYIQLFGR